MKFSCTQENLKHGLLIVSQIASKNANLPILQNVLLKAGASTVTLAATNLEVGVQVKVRGKVDKPGLFTLPAQLFTNYIALLPTERVDCELVGKEVHLSANGQTTIVKGEEAADFPILPEIEQTNSYRITKAGFELALQQTSIAAAVNESRPEIAGVCIKIRENQLILAATDSYRLAECTLALLEGSDDQTVIIPQRSAQELLRLLQSVTADEVVFYLSENQFACRFADVDFISRLVEGKFPDYEQIIPKTGQTTAQIAKEDFIKAIKRAALFSKTGVNDITLTFSEVSHTVQIQAANVKLGQNSTTQSAKVEGEEVAITFSYRYVLDGLQHIAGSEVKCLLNGSMGPTLFQAVTDDQFLYIVMPIKQ